MQRGKEKAWAQAGAFATVQEHQQALYCLLCEFDRVCQALEIPYFLYAGTLLGAVRHQGFVPWDDDLDVLMHRQDYERFLKEAPEVLDQERFFLQKAFSEHYPMFFSKLRLNGTTCLEKFHPKDPLAHEGVYMDIFPCDHAYDSRIGRKLQFLCSKVVIAKALGARGFDTDSILKKTAMVLSRILPGRLFHRIVLGPKRTGSFVHSFLGGASKYSHSVFPREYFAKDVLLPFGDGTFPVPEQYDGVLRVLYGDYWKIPSQEERKCKQHTFLVDLNHSYEDYGTCRDGVQFDSPIRSIR